MRPRSKFLLLAILPLLVSLGLIALAIRQQQQDLSRRERQVVETAYMASKQAELLNYVSLARSVLAPLYDTRSASARISASTATSSSSIPAATTCCTRGSRNCRTRICGT